MRIVVVIACSACAGAQHPGPTTGSIGGLARDHDSGETVAKAEIFVHADGHFDATHTITSQAGMFALDHIKPGRYSLTGNYAGQAVDVENIDVRTGEATIVDLEFTLGRPDTVRIDFGDPKLGEVDHFRPPHHEGTGLIEGTVNDAGSHERVAGAIVTAIGDHHNTLQAVSDDQGRYRFDPVVPGTYYVSAYYTINGRGQIEVRRLIDVAPADGVTVPLWVELAKQ